MRPAGATVAHPPSMLTRAVKLCVPLVLAAPPTLAIEPPPSRLELSLPGGSVVDYAVLAASAGLFTVGTLIMEPPSASQVAPLDGLGHRDRNVPIGLTTDLVFAVGSLGAIGGAFFVERDLGAHGWQWIRTARILLEAEAVTIGVVTIIKNVGGVCRPRSWDDLTSTCDSTNPEDRRSFPSGHTAPLAALSGASLGMWLLPSGPRSRGHAALFFATTTLAVTNTALRVAAGAHSWVDTSVGFGLGFGLGFATAALHVRRVPVAITASTSGVALSGRW